MSLRDVSCHNSSVRMLSMLLIAPNDPFRRDALSVPLSHVVRSSPAAGRRSEAYYRRVFLPQTVRSAISCFLGQGSPTPDGHPNQPATSTGFHLVHEVCAHVLTAVD